MRLHDTKREFLAAASKNFRATVRLLAKLPTSKSEECGGYVFVSTGVAIPDQNYACSIAATDASVSSPQKGRGLTARTFSPGEIVRRSAHFFSGEGVPYTWWIPPEAEAEPMRIALETHGMPERCSPPAMALSLTAHADPSPLPSGYAMQHISISHYLSVAVDPDIWARCSLEGFDSGGEHEESFSAFSTALGTPPFDKNFRLLTLFVEGVPAATALLSLMEDIAGIYYFSTVPAYRRRGLGMLLLQKTLGEARRAGCSTVTLQASPMGYPLYKRAGFVECGRFRVHSADPEAC